MAIVLTSAKHLLLSLSFPMVYEGCKVQDTRPIIFLQFVHLDYFHYNLNIPLPMFGTPAAPRFFLPLFPTFSSQRRPWGAAPRRTYKSVPKVFPFLIQAPPSKFLTPLQFMRISSTRKKVSTTTTGCGSTREGSAPCTLT